MNETWLVIDNSNLIYRAAYANTNLKTSTGRFSGHIFGSVASLLAVLRNELKDQKVRMAFCYDGKDSKAFRRTILPEYKANRIPKEFNPILEANAVLKLWNGLHIEQADREGDDGIAFCVQMLKGKPCVVYSGDRDLWSLLQYPNCKVLSPNLRRFVEPSDIYDAYHTLSPERIPLAKSLFGDSSDGIIGVPRLIKKQVEPILNQDGVLTPETFYDRMGNIKPSSVSDKMWGKLIEAKDKVIKNYQVILPQLKFDRESVVKVSGNVELLKASLIEYECFSLIGQL